jgi:hypothetical protein
MVGLFVDGVVAPWLSQPEIPAIAGAVAVLGWRSTRFLPAEAT